MTTARDWYEARDAAGDVVFEFTAGAGTVLGIGILPKRGTALDGVAYGAAPAVRAALEAQNFTAACDTLLGAVYDRVLRRSRVPTTKGHDAANR